MSKERLVPTLIFYLNYQLRDVANVVFVPQSYIIMDWLKKKKKMATQAAAKISNKRSTFQGEGNVLGGTSEDSSVPSSAAASRSSCIKVPFNALPVRL